MRFGLKKRTENENINSNIEKKSYIDHVKRDMKMVHYPDWKPVQKEKWVGGDF